ncbi:MAG: phosphatidylglycerophosphatase A [Betaproteobacteria bacterium]|nr:phosphatidylglycerophosphatase A [Betaproteobacteria bacterium]
MINLKFLFSNIWHFIALGFGAGLIKKGTGTFGTLITFIYFIFIYQLNLEIQILIFFILLLVSYISVKNTLQSLKIKDPSCVVIDEIIAYLIVLILLPNNYLLYLISFILFRFFDILKPWPISKLEELPGAIGVIADDFGAALFALVITQMVSSYVL